MAADDLLDHFRLDAEVFDDHTIHLAYKPSRGRGSRRKVEIKWERKEKLGSGQFGQVWKESHTSPSGDQDVRAVKVIEKQRMQVFQVDYKKELLALAKFSKEEYRQADILVSFLGWYETEQSVFLAMEYFEHGDLAQHIPSISTEEEVRQITIDLLEGLRIIHREGFAHRDLKPQNIFVTERPPYSPRWWVKIGDFSISKRVTNDETAFRTQIGTPHFQAPEIHGFIDHDEESSGYKNTVDIWSLGCVVYNISAHKVPFTRSFEINNFCHKLSPFPREPLSRALSQTGIQFIESLIVPEPTERMTIDHALEHSWLRNVSSTPSQDESIPIVFSKDVEDSEGGQREFDQTVHFSHAADSAVGHRSTRDWPGQLAVTGAAEPSLSQRTKQAADKDVMNHNQRPLEICLATSTSQNQDRTPLRSWPSSLTTPVSTTNLESLAMEVSTQLLANTVNYWRGSLALTGHELEISLIAFSPDGTLIASASHDKTIILWDPATGLIRNRLVGHTQIVCSIAFSSDSTLVVSGSCDETVVLWDAATGDVNSWLVIDHVQVPASDHGQALAVACSPDNTLIASLLGGTKVMLLNTVSENWMRLEAHRELQNSVVFSPDGALVAAGASDGTAIVWHVATGKIYREFKTSGDAVTSVAFSPDNAVIASASGKTISLWGLVTKQIRRLQGHADQIVSIVFSPDGELIASGARDKKIILWEALTGNIRSIFEGHKDVITSVAFSPDSKLIASGSKGALHST